MVPEQWQTPSSDAAVQSALFAHVLAAAAQTLPAELFVLRQTPGLGSLPESCSSSPACPCFGAKTKTMVPEHVTTANFACYGTSANRREYIKLPIAKPSQDSSKAFPSGTPGMGECVRVVI